jgi:branched-chain amino acid aminotransferase
MSQDEMGPVAIRSLIGSAVEDLMKGVENIDLPVSVIQHLTWEQVVALEAEGIVFSGVNEEHPNGGIYLKDAMHSELGLNPAENERKSPHMFDKHLTSVTATSFLRGATGLITRPPINKLPEDISGLRRFPMNSLVAAVFKEGKWSESHVLPDGKWIRGGYDDSTSQYGQSCFEGMVATDTQEEDPVELNVINGKVTVFRPEENAKRFQKSCESVGLPPIAVDQFVAAVLSAIKNNKGFIPKNGKLYCRPFMVGMEGGTGIIPATSCLFAVEVSPYGTYLSAKSDGVDLEKELPGSRVKAIKYQRPKSGKHKISGNYGAMIKEKQDAKHEGFNDVLLLDDHGRIQECASNNVFLVEHDSDTHFTLYTSSLDANILPGITRASIIELLRDRKLVQERFGQDLNITVRDDEILHESALTHMDGAFGSGTAAGIGNFHEIQMRSGKSMKFHKGTPTQHFIKQIYDLLQDLRRGKVPGYEKWVTKVD